MGDGRRILREAQTPKAHSQELLGMIQEVLNAGGISLADLDVLACTRGPGHFTGIRIACSLIQGLALGLNKPVMALSSLQLMALGLYRNTAQHLSQVASDRQQIRDAAQHTRIFAYIPAYPAPRIYGAYYEADAQGVLQGISAEAIYADQQFLVDLCAQGWVVGTGEPCAADLLLLAEQAYTAGQLMRPADLQPVYLEGFLGAL